jgi:hypothetical protein
MTWWDAIAIRIRLTLMALRRAVSLVLPLIVLSIAASGVYDGISKYFRGAGSKPQTFEEKIAALTSSLNDAAGQVSEIEQEIARRKLLAEQLQQEADLAKKISTLNAEQVAAVSQPLRGELHAETRSEFWSNATINALFALLGAVFGEIFRIFREWRRARAVRNS